MSPMQYSISVRMSTPVSEYVSSRVRSAFQKHCRHRYTFHRATDAQLQKFIQRTRKKKKIKHSSVQPPLPPACTVLHTVHGKVQYNSAIVLYHPKTCRFLTSA
eukprot:GFKZ01002941.1.p2 GENE.GFKZ01002941.1~~GFKZ01002941.1.p2  ORF type:complete len:103 (-),score=0.33 GFKZ01002941.1:95-403(-)